MIVVSIDIHPQGRPPREGDRRAQLVIWNTGNGTREVGDYEAKLVRGDAPTSPMLITDEHTLAHIGGFRFPRTNKQRHVANLVREVLVSMGDVDLPGYGA